MSNLERFVPARFGVAGRRTVIISRTTARYRVLRRIKAWDTHILCQKYGAVKLVVSGVAGRRTVIISRTTARYRVLRRIKAWDTHILCQKYGAVKLVVSGVAGRRTVIISRTTARYRNCTHQRSR